ncbi:MAG TPA: ABC transporter ATP-binding protein [Candidatus Acidoferrum sp.]|nr:ABC transporter ATP-binding protein [Candidatus Acidoferrum sp.]
MKLEIENLSRRFGTRTVLQAITLQADDGLLGLVGPNGAGKTTLMRIVATLLTPSSGRVTWEGLDTVTDANRVRASLGYLPQHFGVYPELTGRRFLEYLATMKGIHGAAGRRRVDEVLELVNLVGDADRRLGTYSGGMLQRIGIAQALLNDPQLLIVDEPTVGLDPAERVRFRTLLAGLTQGRLVILSTHIVSDVEAVAARLVVLRDGRVLADSTPEALIDAARGAVWEITTDPATAGRLQAGWAVSGLVSLGNRVTIRIVSSSKPSESAQLVEPNLEDAYLLTIGAVRRAA